MAMKKKNLPEVVPEVVPQIFELEDYGQIRFVWKGEEIWFVAADVCRALEIKQPTRALNRLDDDEKGVTNIHTLGGEQKMLIVSEPGLYRLVFASRKKNAKEFQRKVYHEVLPSIRKYGYYSVKPPEEEKIYVEITGNENFKLFKKKYPEIDFEKALRRLGFTKIYDEHGYYHEEDVFLLRFNPDDYEKISRDPLSVCFLKQIIPNKESTNRRISQTTSQSRKKINA